jgi:hypothetical protein
VRHDRGVQVQIIWGANLIPVGGPRAARDDFAAAKPACSRMPAKGVWD